jgi:hypothetical protein
MKGKTIIMGIGALAAIGGLVWYFRRQSPAAPAVTDTPAQQTTTTPAAPVWNKPAPPADIVKELQVFSEYKVPEQKVAPVIQATIFKPYKVDTYTPPPTSGKRGEELLGLGYAMF